VVAPQGVTKSAGPFLAVYSGTRPGAGEPAAG